MDLLHYHDAYLGHNNRGKLGQKSEIGAKCQNREKSGEIGENRDFIYLYQNSY